jgi:hypothetical protein
MALGQSTPRAVLQQVLRYEELHDNADDIIFNRRNIEIYRKWMTPGLYRLHLIEDAREKQEAKENPDDKPFFEDMTFSPMKELCKVHERTYPQRFSLSKSRVIGNLAYVRARFFYHQDCDYGNHTFYTFILKRIRSAWLVDDIDYGKNGTLRRALRREGF